MSAATAKTYTPDDLLARADEHGYELVDGKLERKAMGAEADWVASNLLTVLWAFVMKRELGTVFGAETGYRCFPNAPNRVRKPDVSFVAKGRLPGGRIPKGFITIAPDLAVESLSPRDNYYRTDAKLHQLLEAGVKLLWVINPDNRTVKVYEAGSRNPVELTDSDVLTGGNVLPEFQIAVRDLFPDETSAGA